MANQFASTSSVGAAFGILKNWYAGPLVSQFNDDIPFYKQMEKGKEKWNGVQVVRPLKVRRNPGIGATSDGGNLPKIGSQTTIQAAIAAKYNYLRFGITGPMIKASQGDKGSFANAMEYEMTEGLNDLKQDVNRQIFWDGTSDLATVSANVLASNTVVVTGRESTEDGSKYLDIGIAIDIVDASTGAVKASGVTITAISGTTTATLTLDSAVSCSATDVVVRTGTFGNEVQGILTTLDGGTSTIFAVDRSLYPAYQGNVSDALGGQLTLDKIQFPFNEARRRGGAKTDCVYTDFNTERMYNKLLISDKRYQGKVKGDGTFSDKDKTYLEWAGIPMVADKDAPARIFFLDSSTWKKYVLAELEWADDGGRTMIEQVGVDAYEARLRLFMNMFCEKPSANAVLKNYISP